MSEKHLPYIGGNFDRIIMDGDSSVWVKDGDQLLQEAVVLLLQDLRARKNPNTNKGSRYWREATSLLDRLGAPYTPDVDTDKAEAESTRETANGEARDAFRDMFADTYEALDDLVYRPKEPFKDWHAEAVTLQARLTRAEESCDRITKERDKLADQLADAGVDILDLRNELAFTEGERAKVADELTDMENDRDKWRERVKYLEVECDRIQVYCENLMKANTRLMDEKNKAAVAAIEGVA